MLDIDGTDDPAHGKQEGGAYHGYYRHYMDQPLLVVVGDTGQPLTVVLRPGTVHAGRGSLPSSRGWFAWSAIPIELRGDSGVALPAIYTSCEQQAITYTIGLGSNARLEAMAAPLLALAKQQRAETGQTVRLVADGQYAADSWETQRRVVYKADALEKGTNTRFVVTTRQDAVYAWNIRRGDQPESCIKDRKGGCFADRLSDHAFWANQVRLLLSAAAYWLLETIRRWLARRTWPPLQMGPLRLQVLKIGGWVRSQLDAISLHLARPSRRGALAAPGSPAGSRVGQLPSPSGTTHHWCGWPLPGQEAARVVPYGAIPSVWAVNALSEAYPHPGSALLPPLCHAESRQCIIRAKPEPPVWRGTGGSPSRAVGRAEPGSRPPCTPIGCPEGR